MRIGIIQFPGSNCERETMLAVKRAQMQPVAIMWNNKKEQLRDLDGYIIVGGFSYEDRSRAGVIAALDPIMQEIKQQSENGKPVLGICNGAQILVETGLVPGLSNHKLGLALTENKRMQNGNVLRTGYYNAWIHMRLSNDYQRNAFTQYLSPQDILSVPIAHAEGRFVMTDALLSEIKVQGLNLFQYCDAAGNITADFPINPNGSIDNIAGVSNKAGNVLALMPHPERTPNGDAIFTSMRNYLATEKNPHTVPLYYYPRKSVYAAYSKEAQHHECIVELMITDNHALTVQNTLRQLGYDITVKRQVHWEIECGSELVLAAIKRTGVLYNDRKESLAAALPQSYLVRAKDDMIGQQKLQTLKNHFEMQGIAKIRHGVLWHFGGENATMATIEKILQTNIISNPYVHDCYRYN